MLNVNLPIVVTTYAAAVVIAGRYVGALAVEVTPLLSVVAAPAKTMPLALNVIV